MGHKISKEQIDPSVKDYIMSFVGDVDDLETEVKSDIISAVNSLIVDRVDNIENMGKLAEAIGEPVTASDSVDEVVEKVDELVTDFKSKVLNAGIMYESGDRFKELIDKLEGLVAGEGGGIQISTGHFDITTLQPASEGMGVLTSNQLNFNPPLNFTPDRVILSIPKLQLGTSVGGDYAHHSIDSEIHSAANHRFTIYDENGKDINMYIGTVIDDITAEGFVLNAGKNTTDYALTTPEGIDWLAIGVGEGQEDNTLLETLKGILEDEGVELTGEETMADLIVEVDNEFDRKNANMISYCDVLNPRLNVARSFAGAGVYNNKIYLMGGVNHLDTYMSDVEYIDYTVEGSTWIHMNSTLMSVPRSNFGVVTIGSKFYCIGGVNSSTSAFGEHAIFDASNNTWSRITSAPPITTTSAVACDNNNIVIYGYSGTTFSRVDYTISTNKFTTTSIGGHSFNHYYGDLKYINGLYYLISGRNNAATYFRAVGGLESFNPSSNTFTPCDNYMLFPVVDSANCVYNGYIYLFGGRMGNTAPVDYVQRFNISNNTWEVLNVKLSTARYGAASVLIGSKFYCIGGFDNFGYALDTIEVCDLSKL